MSHVSDQFEHMALDDFEELLADMPRDERCEHYPIVQNSAFGLRRRLRTKGGDCRVFSETFYMKSRGTESATLPDVIVRCGPRTPGATSIEDSVVEAALDLPSIGMSLPLSETDQDVLTA